MSKFTQYLLLPAALGVLFTGCASQTEDSSTESTTVADDSVKVEVPEIEGAVEASEFCALADELTCAGALGCCGDPEFASVDSCVEQSMCAQGLGKALASEALANGELIYDAVAAGDYLRDFASHTAGCEEQSVDLRRPTFLRGSRDVGEDCSPVGDDITNMFLCADGLECVITVDGETKERKGTCAIEDLSTAPGAEGEACATGEDCSSGMCSDGVCQADLESLYCVSPMPQTPPPNAIPTYLYLDLSGSSSGSTGNVTLTYSKNNTYYRCTITDTLSDGQEKVCAVSSTGDISGPDDQFFDIDMTSNDGIRVDTVCACEAANPSTNKCTTEIECAGTFNKAGTSKPGWCSDASFNVWLWANACKKIWVDGDGNGSCTSFEIDMDNSNYTTCES